jgi:hypothetical protein
MKVLERVGLKPGTDFCFFSILCENGRYVSFLITTPQYVVRSDFGPICSAVCFTDTFISDGTVDTSYIGITAAENKFIATENAVTNSR